LVQLVQTAWNLFTSIAFLAAFFYAYQLNQTFKGGKLSKTYSYILWAFAVAFFTFFLSFLFNLMNITPTTSFGISVRDLGSLIFGALFLASLREAARFWVQSKNGFVGSK